MSGLTTHSHIFNTICILSFKIEAISAKNTIGLSDFPPPLTIIRNPYGQVRRLSARSVGLDHRTGESGPLGQLKLYPRSVLFLSQKRPSAIPEDGGIAGNQHRLPLWSELGRILFGRKRADGHALDKFCAESRFRAGLPLRLF